MDQANNEDGINRSKKELGKDEGVSTDVFNSLQL